MTIVVVGEYSAISGVIGEGMDRWLGRTGEKVCVVCW